MLHNGLYVRLVIAPRTRMGTISQVSHESGKTKLLFHHDERFRDRLPDLWLFEDEAEECLRPTDEEVKTIDKLIERGT